MKNNPIRAWEIYQATKLFFAGKYDAPKYQFKMSSRVINRAKFDVNNLRYTFAALSREFPNEKDYLTLIVENFMIDEKFFIKNINRNLLSEFHRYFDSVCRSLLKELKQIDQYQLATPGYVLNHSELSHRSKAILNWISNHELTREIENIEDPLGINKQIAQRIDCYTRCLPFFDIQLSKEKIHNTITSLFT
jgi:hypothetical protein